MKIFFSSIELSIAIFEAILIGHQVNKWSIRLIVCQLKIYWIELNVFIQPRPRVRKR